MGILEKLPATPGKVLAVHVAYESRAAQRGRRPKQPSYFMKATSSLSESGTVERPKGCELLAFEGEVALIIGTEARNVSLENAWDYVAAVTASNDLGIYDYRAQDKGSNTRSKSRDGYTPIGPELIDARAVEPGNLRIRTWVNGELVQEGNTSEESLIFPLPQFVADLSQHMTLHPGDIILTGTPAGSTVVNPGDVMEVEVDGAGLTSGKLRTEVIEGVGTFDENIGMLPHVDEKQRADAYGTDPDGSGSSKSDLPDDLRKKLEQTPTAGLSAQLRNRGLNQVVIEGVYPQTPGTKMVGVAKTLRFIPGREDLFKAHGGGYNTQKRAFDELKPGEVLVIEARQEAGSGTLGDVLAIRAKSLGAAGIVTDGCVRDYAAVQEVGLPVFTQGAHPAVLGRKHVPWDMDLPIACGNATVIPGDVIVGDDDGVIVIPRGIVEEVVDAAMEKELQDEWVAARVSEGNPVDGLFPPTGDWKDKWQQYRKERT
ncbi:fumarylacetoacetate hydrolase family protein [Corynebacterium pseudopelargi]|uniref:Homoprotocatechuate catabolism bifunctional isomerase/decarboxylase n=1 Tax=Corynebacterium pseudopelargi TaxID=2080757 RepID=A0A3G6J084_9CORY|nr:fumarylacetoacetate hydrolase family protein [Corynebacterium pseudopelargi]AZA09750.1 Homoprotocatechuate catabolism bifunctional isomerase/decarboxylase [Corynebacterium pseudopelargi]